MITIVNRKTYKGKGVYIGRLTSFGNPYVIGKDGTREEVIEKYKMYIRYKIKTDSIFCSIFMNLVKKYLNAEDIVLICWCKPEACHGDVLKEMIEEALGC